MAPTRVAPGEYRYSVVFEPVAKGEYVVIIPALPGLVNEGGALEAAREMAGDATGRRIT